MLQPPGKQADNAPVEARTDVLTYTSPPLAADHNLIGPVSARIYVRAEREHADVFVRLCDVDTAGVSRNITDGIRRLDPRTVPAADVTGRGDGFSRSTWSCSRPAYRMQAGHRLRVQVSGGAFPRFARNFGTADRSAWRRPGCGASSRSSPTRSVRRPSYSPTAIADVKRKIRVRNDPGSSALCRLPRYQG